MINVEYEKNLKIMHIVSDDLWGGAETQAQILLEGLSQSCDLALLTFNSGQLSKKIGLLKNVTLKSLDEKNGLIRLIKNSYKFAKEYRANIIHSHGYKEAFIACVIAKLCNAKWIHQVHGSSENYSGLKLLKSKLYQSLEKLLVRNFAHKIIFASEKSRATLGYNNVSSTCVVYNAAKAESHRNNIEPEHDVFKIFMIGRLAPIKRVDIAINTFAYLLQNYSFSMKIELHLLGEGPLKENLKNLATSYPHIESNVFFRGFAETPLKILEEECNLVFMTSDNEGIPTTILESMLLSIPILSRSVGGIPEIKKMMPSYPLILVQSHDKQILADKLREMILNYKIIKKEALSIDCSYYTPQRLISEHMDIYHNV